MLLVHAVAVKSLLTLVPIALLRYFCFAFGLLLDR